MSDHERPCGCLFKGYEVVSQCVYHTGRQHLIESLEIFRRDAKVENAELHSQIESLQRENEELNGRLLDLQLDYVEALTNAITPEMRERIGAHQKRLENPNTQLRQWTLAADQIFSDLLGEQG